MLRAYELLFVRIMLEVAWCTAHVQRSADTSRQSQSRTCMCGAGSSHR